jgi:hypothetical protein
MSPKQQAYLGDMLGQFYLELTDGLTIKTISYEAGKKILDGLIDARRLKMMGRNYTLPAGVSLVAHPGRGKPRERTPTRQPMPDVPQGYYAIPGDGDIDFYFVKDGKKDGYKFVKRVVGGHVDMPVNYKTARLVLKAIMDFGLREAGLLYATKIKHCMHCNKHLTKFASRVMGKGRTCAGQRGQGGDWDAIQLGHENEVFDDE